MLLKIVLFNERIDRKGVRAIMSLEYMLKRALKSNELSQIHLAFEKIYLTYGKLIYLKIMQYIDNKNDAEELAQDVFVRFYNHLQNKSIDNIKYYLLTSAKNIAIDFLKRKRVEIIYDENILNEELYECKPSIEYKELMDKMRIHLNDFEIDLILKHNLDNITFKELSSIYNKPLNTILSIYHRALKKIRKCGDIYE